MVLWSHPSHARLLLGWCRCVGWSLSQTRGYFGLTGRFVAKWKLVIWRAASLCLVWAYGRKGTRNFLRGRIPQPSAGFLNSTLAPQIESFNNILLQKYSICSKWHRHKTKCRDDIYFLKGNVYPKGPLTQCVLVKMENNFLKSFNYHCVVEGKEGFPVAWGSSRLIPHPPNKQKREKYNTLGEWHYSIWQRFWVLLNNSKILENAWDWMQNKWWIGGKCGILENFYIWNEN